MSNSEANHSNGIKMNERGREGIDEQTFDFQLLFMITILVKEKNSHGEDALQFLFFSLSLHLFNRRKSCVCVCVELKLSGKRNIPSKFLSFFLDHHSLKITYDSISVKKFLSIISSVVNITLYYYRQEKDDDRESMIHVTSFGRFIELL